MRLIRTMDRILSKIGLMRKSRIIEYAIELPRNSCIGAQNKFYFAKEFRNYIPTMPDVIKYEILKKGLLNQIAPHIFQRMVVVKTEPNLLEDSIILRAEINLTFFNDIIRSENNSAKSVDENI